MALVTSGGVLGTSPASNPTDFANRQQIYFNPKLLQALQYNLRIAKYGLSEGYSTIGDKIRFFRPRKASVSYINAQTLVGLSVTPLTTPTALSEGVKPTNLTEVAIGYVDILLTQRAGLANLTDKLQALDLLNTLKVYTDKMGEDAALDYDTVIRNWLISGLYGSDNTYNNGNDGGYFERFCGIVNTGDSSNDFGSLGALSKSNGKVTRASMLGVATQLKTSKVPKKNGKYIAIVPPQVIHDIRQDTTWVQTGTYQAKDQLFKDMSIELDGIVYEEANNPWIEGDTYGTESQTDPGTGLIYSTVVLGADAFGIPNLTNKQAGGSQSAPKLIILNSPDKADPVNQITTIGWKSMFGAAPFITNVTGERPRYCVVRSKSTFV
jgi:N4-gp56 family major capsid protein